MANPVRSVQILIVILIGIAVIFSIGLYNSMYPDIDFMTNQQLRELGTNHALQVLCDREPLPHSVPYCDE